MDSVTRAPRSDAGECGQVRVLTSALMTSTHDTTLVTIVGWKGIAVPKQGKRKRPWWSYASLSVRALIVLIVVIGAGLAWVAVPASDQRSAVLAIEESGGKVWYDSLAEATPIAQCELARCQVKSRLGRNGWHIPFQPGVNRYRIPSPPVRRNG